MSSIFSLSFSLLSSQRGKDQERPLAGALESHCPLIHQVHHLALQLLDNLFRTLDRGCVPARLLSPAVNAVKLLSATPLFRLEFVAMPTVSPNWQRGHNELGAARFTSAIFSVAMLPKMTPFEVTAREFLLVVKAHLSCYYFVSQS